jgi:hypothetical protein
MALQWKRVMVPLLAFALTSCGDQTIRDYARLTSQTTADLDSKIRLYANSAADFDASRQQSEVLLEAQNNSDNDTVTRTLDIWTLVGDKQKPVLFNQLRQDSEHSLAIQLRPPPATTALAPIKSPPELTDVAKATDQLSRNQSLSEQRKELFAYGQEVRDDLKKDQKSKAAESSLAQGAPKTVPNKP